MNRDAPPITQHAFLNATARDGGSLTLSILEIHSALPFLAVRSSHAGIDVILEPAVTRALIAALIQTLPREALPDSSVFFSGITPTPAPPEPTKPPAFRQPCPPSHPDGFFDPLEMSTQTLERAVQAARLDSLEFPDSMQADIQVWLEIAETELGRRGHSTQRPHLEQFGTASNDSLCCTPKGDLTQSGSSTGSAPRVS